MDNKKFQQEIQRAMASKIENPDYWIGFLHGVMRRLGGKKYVSDDKHELWMSLFDDIDKYKSERGRGYRDGLKGNG